jgi:hypothetical protein
MPLEQANNHMHSDSKKRRSFLALLFAAGDVWRYALRSDVFSDQVTVIYAVYHDTAAI